ncbi:hypothetical protein DFJ74DRAFT_748832 [Hyaloraphidium curvatum]|nr:hypothetical protein DFJ74DRAFT_748832 [Hyaloraphidium curvatum]
MAFRIAGKRAFVTGGTDGIGRAVAERLLALGARVVVASNAAHGRQVLSELQARFGDRAAGFVMLDVCSRSELREGFAEGIRVLGGVDMVVANAGFASDIMSFHPARGTPLGPADLDREDDARWVRDIDGNLVGFGLLVRLATAYWWKNDMPGALVATASFAAIFGAGKVFGKSHFSFSYPATKAGQIAITNNMQLFVDGAAGEWCSPDTPEKVERSPMFGPWVEGLGGWVPMEKLVDAYVRVIEDEHIRGQAFAVVGSGGKMVPYVKDFALDEYISKL